MSTKENKESKSISKSKSTSSTSKKSKKRSQYEMLPSLKSGERSPTKPNDYIADLSLKGMLEYSKKRAVLSSGKLSIEKPNGGVQHVIDLGLSEIAYYKKAKRILVNTDTDMTYHFKAKTEDAFNQWLEQIRIHRLYGQNQANLKQEQNSVKKPASEMAVADQSEPDNKQLRKLHDDVTVRLNDVKKLIDNAETTDTVTKEHMIKTMKPIVAEAINSHQQFEDKFFKNATLSSELSSTSQPLKTKRVLEVEESDTEEEELARDSALSITTPESSGASSVIVAKTEATAPAPKTISFKRRNRLPASMKDFGLPIWYWVLEQTMTRDLSKIKFPLELFEPLNLLQVLCEELEYSNLLDRAATTNDVKLRVGLVAAFAVSRYASTVTRIFRKPFDPLEGETFENVREDLGWWYFAEQVSHQPAITAIHAKGKGWDMSQNVSYDLTFLGRSIKAEPKSQVDLVLHTFNERYRWNKVKTSVVNLFTGKRYIDHVGEMIIKGSNKLTCKLTFKKSTREVNGNGYNAGGKVIFAVNGKWSESITVTIDGTSETVWTANPLPSDAAQYYGFTEFATTLNELIPEFRNFLPPTDSRFRTDQRCLEDGRIKEAREQMNLLENSQRERRKKQDYKPKWFKMEKAWKLNTYRFNDRYWEARKNRFTGETFEKLWPASC